MALKSIGPDGVERTRPARSPGELARQGEKYREKAPDSRAKEERQERLVEMVGLGHLVGCDRESEEWKSAHDSISSNPHYSGFISAYRSWTLDKSNSISELALAEAIVFCGIERLMQRYGARPGEVYEVVRPKIVELIRLRPEEELREVYDTVVALIEDGKPSGNIYHQLISAYAEVLRDCERASHTGYLLAKYVGPQFGNESFLDGRDAYEALKNAPLEQTTGADLLFLQRIKTEGITLQELEQYQAHYVGKDRTRNEFHNEIKAYALGLGLGETDVMADIVFRYHNRSAASLRSGKREILFVAGTILVNANYPGFNIDEIRSFKVPADAPDYRQQDMEDCIRQAQELLKAHLDPEDWRKGKYESNIVRRQNKESDDMQILGEVKRDNPDLPVTCGFEVSHSAHGMVVYMLKLTISLESMFAANPNPQARLEELLKYLNGKIGTRY